MRVFFKLTLNIINKSLRIFKVFLEKNFKIELYNKNNILMVALILDLFEVNNTIEKWGGKKSIIYSYSAWYFEIIFILLVKIIAV